MYNLQSLIEGVSERPYDLKKNNPFLKEEHKDSFQTNIEELKEIKKGQLSPLNIVLMGEVKAGKSTLLNAMVGESVSNVGVTETTAVILEVSYGMEKEGIIHYKNGEEEIVRIEELNQKLNKKQIEGDIDFYSKIEKVALTYPLTKLQELTIVDTPGVETITTDNQETTDDYIMKSDVVIWLMSANHVGQASILDRIIDIKKRGKPVILIINRMDQVSDSERILDYICDEYDFYVEEVFGLSAEEAFQGIMKKDDKRYRDSGLPDILNYLENNIERSSENLKEELLYESVLPIINREILTHLDMKKEIEIIDKTFETREEQTKIAIDRINTVIDNQFEHWIKHQFLKEEENELLSLTSDASDKIVEDKMKKYFSGDYIKGSVEKMWNELDEVLKEERKTSLKIMDESLEEEVEKIQIEYRGYIDQYDLESYSTSSRDTSSTIMEGAKSGAVVGGTTSLALATYASVLGPYAGYISMGAAFGAYLPPILFASIAGGIAYKIFNKDKNKNDLKNQVINNSEKIRMNIEKNLNKSIRKLKKENKNFFDELNKKMDKELMLDSTLTELKKMDEKISDHLSTLENYRSDLKKELKIIEDNQPHSDDKSEVIDLFDF